MEKPNALTSLTEILPSLQVDLIEAHYTQCSPDWLELDYVPTYCKLYFICKGEGWLAIGGRKFHPKPGQLCLMPAHVEQSYSIVDGRAPFLKYWCHFTAALGSTQLFQWMEVPYCIDVSNPTEVAGLFETLISSHRDHSLAARFREKAGLLQLLSYFADHAASKITERQADDADRIARIRQYVEGHIQDVVTLEDIARHVHLHPNYLIKYFNKHFGMSPLKYINRKRMEKARFLLRTTSLSIKEVAKQTGFEDTNHFAKAFRRETSASPSAWRSTM